MELETLNKEWLPEPWTVSNTWVENNDCFSLEIIPPEGKEPEESIKPGQFHMLYGFGYGEIPISLSGYGDGSVIHTIRKVGAVSTGISNLKPGESIGVRGPFGNHWPMQHLGTKDVLLVAGGVGLAPLKPLIESILADRSRFGQLNLLYGCRNPDQILFRGLLEEWREDINIHETVDSAPPNWTKNIGVVTRLLAKADLNPENTVCYVCGPEIMMRLSAEEIVAMGVKAEDIYISMERNMKCAIGFCGHCQWGPHFLCRTGPILDYHGAATLLRKHEL